MAFLTKKITDAYGYQKKNNDYNNDSDSDEDTTHPTHYANSKHLYGRKISMEAHYDEEKEDARVKNHLSIQFDALKGWRGLKECCCNSCCRFEVFFGCCLRLGHLLVKLLIYLFWFGLFLYAAKVYIDSESQELYLREAKHTPSYYSIGYGKPFDDNSMWITGEVSLWPSDQRICASLLIYNTPKTYEAESLSIHGLLGYQEEASTDELFKINFNGAPVIQRNDINRESLPKKEGCYRLTDDESLFKILQTTPPHFFYGSLKLVNVTNIKYFKFLKTEIQR